MLTITTPRGQPLAHIHTKTMTPQEMLALLSEVPDMLDRAEEYGSQMERATVDECANLAAQVASDRIRIEAFLQTVKESK